MAREFWNSRWCIGDELARLRVSEAALRAELEQLKEGPLQAQEALNERLNGENTALRTALEKAQEGLATAVQDFETIKTLNSHGASDKTYIDWLRSNAKEAEGRARSTLAEIDAAPSASQGKGKAEGHTP